MTEKEKYQKSVIAAHMSISFIEVLGGMLSFILLFLGLGVGFFVSIIVSIFLATLLGGLLHKVQSERVFMPLNDIDSWLDNQSSTNQENPNYKVLKSSSYDSQIIDKIKKHLPGEVNDADVEKLKTKIDDSLDRLSFGIIKLDGDGNIVSMNKAAEAILGHSIASLGGNNFVEKFDLRQGDVSILKIWLKSVSKSLKDTESSWSSIQLIQPNSDSKWLDIYASSNISNDPATPFLLTLIDRGNGEDDGDNIDFIAIAAHELRAPITVIRGYLQVFEDEVKDNITEEQREFLQKMNVSAQQLAGFINNILNVARAKQGELHVNIGKSDWAKFAQERYEDLSLRAETHQKKLELKIEDGLPEVAADESMISHVINNLVDNSIKYGAKEDTILIEVKRNGEFVETTISDHGIGIPGSLVENLFTKFYRSHRSKRKYGGTGLGLFLCKSIVDAHGGNIWVKSQEGQGSTFGFSVQTYDKFASTLKDGDNDNDLTRTGHGWIKNHSMYRR